MSFQWRSRGAEEGVRIIERGLEKGSSVAKKRTTAKVYGLKGPEVKRDKVSPGLGWERVHRQLAWVGLESERHGVESRRGSMSFRKGSGFGREGRLVWGKSRRKKLPWDVIPPSRGMRERMAER